MSPDIFWQVTCIFCFVGGTIVGAIYTLWVTSDED